MEHKLNLTNPKPPKRTGRTDNEKELDSRFGEDATALIKGAMGLVNVDFIELAKRLEDQGSPVSVVTLRKKVNNGQCKASFVMRIMDALEVDLAPIKKRRTKNETLL